MLNLISEDKLPFWSVCELLSDKLQPYDVLVFPDGKLRPDSLQLEDLAAYSRIVLPHCHLLTTFQAELLLAYLESGSRIALMGPAGSNLDMKVREALESHPGTEVVVGAPTLEQLVGTAQVRPSIELNGALNLQRVSKGVAVHLIRYDFDRALDLTPSIGNLTLAIELEGNFVAAEAYGSPKPPIAELWSAENVHTLRLRDIPLYSIILLREADGLHA
jgi:hypothetical protein